MTLPADVVVDADYPAAGSGHVVALLHRCPREVKQRRGAPFTRGHAEWGRGANRTAALADALVAMRRHLEVCGG